MRRVRDVSSEVAELQAARTELDAARTRRREAETALEGAEIAQSAIGLSDPATTLATRIYEKAEPFLKVGRDRFPALILDLQDEVTAAKEAEAEARQIYDTLRRVEVARRVEALRPQHQQAVQRIAGLVEALSAAIEEERVVRAGLADVGAAHALPDAGVGIGTLRDPASALAAWNRQMLVSGAL